MRVRRPSVADIRNRRKQLKKYDMQLKKTAKQIKTLERKFQRIRIKRFS